MDRNPFLSTWRTGQRVRLFASHVKNDSNSLEILHIRRDVDAGNIPQHKSSVRSGFFHHAFQYESFLAPSKQRVSRFMDIARAHIEQTRTSLSIIWHHFLLIFICSPGSLNLSTCFWIHWPPNCRTLINFASKNPLFLPVLHLMEKITWPSADGATWKEEGPGLYISFFVIHPWLERLYLQLEGGYTRRFQFLNELSCCLPSVLPSILSMHCTFPLYLALPIAHSSRSLSLSLIFTQLHHWWYWF